MKTILETKDFICNMDDVIAIEKGLIQYPILTINIILPSTVLQIGYRQNKEARDADFDLLKDSWKEGIDWVQRSSDG